MKRSIWREIIRWVRLLARRPLPRKVTTAVATWWEWGGWMGKPTPHGEGEQP